MNDLKLDQYLKTAAGRVWITTQANAAGAGSSVLLYTRAEDYLGSETPERAEVCDPPHPECYVLRYADGSLIAVSNAGDEYWAAEADYLAHYDLKCIDHPEHGWMYVAEVPR